MVAPLVMMGLNAAADAIGALAGGTASPSAATGARDNAATRKTASEFERMFLETSLDRLTAASGEDGPLGDNGTGGGVYRSMLVKEYAGEIVKSGGVGIASTIYRQMLQMQEASHGG